MKKLDKRIKAIYKMENVVVKNLHNNTIWKNEEFLCLERVDGTKEYIDLVALTDLTHAIVGSGDENAYFEIIDEGKIIRDILEENLMELNI